MSDTGPSEPSRPTVKMLFAACGDQCAFPSCTVPAFDRASQTVLVELCHIEGHRPSSARHNREQSNEARHAYSNLILMCRPHHNIIDQNQDTWTVAALQALKAEHESRASGAEPLNEEDTSTAASAALEKYFGVQAISGDAVVGQVVGHQSASTISNVSFMQAAQRADPGNVIARVLAERAANTIADAWEDFARLITTFRRRDEHGNRDWHDELSAEWRELFGAAQEQANACQRDWEGRLIPYIPPGLRADFQHLVFRLVDAGTDPADVEDQLLDDVERLFIALIEQDRGGV